MLLFKSEYLKADSGYRKRIWAEGSEFPRFRKKFLDSERQKMMNPQANSYLFKIAASLNFSGLYILKARMMNIIKIKLLEIRTHYFDKHLP